MLVEYSLNIMNNFYRYKIITLQMFMWIHTFIDVTKREESKVYFALHIFLYISALLNCL